MEHPRMNVSDLFYGSHGPSTLSSAESSETTIVDDQSQTWILDVFENSSSSGSGNLVATISSSSSTMSSGNWSITAAQLNNNSSLSPVVILPTTNIRDLEAVQDPIQSVIAWMFYLTAFFSLIFNISAIILLVSQFRSRRRRSHSKSTRSSRFLTAAAAPPLSYSPSVKQVPNNSCTANCTTLVIATSPNPNVNSNSNCISTPTTFQHLYHHHHHHHHLHHPQSNHYPILPHPNQQQYRQTKTTRSSTAHKVRSGSSQLRIYLLNLFLNDILIALFTTPFGYTDFMYGHWKWPAFLCPATNFITTCAVAVSIYTLIAIGLERYFAIICPFKKLVPFERHTKWIIALIWTIGIILASPLLFMVRAVPFRFGTADLLDCRELWEGQQGGKIYTYVVFSCTFLVPFIALTYLYVSIAIKAFRHVIPGNADASRDQLQLRNKIRMVKMLVFLVITFAVCWLPIQTFNLVMWVCDSCRTSFNTPALRLMYYIISFGCQWLSIAHSLLDPIIYCFNSRNFKISEICDELGSLGKWLICCIGRGRSGGRGDDGTGHNSCTGNGSPESHNGCSLTSGGGHYQGNSDCGYYGYSTASFSGGTFDGDPRRLSRASISSSLPSSGRNSVAIHSPSAFSTRSCTCGVNGCAGSAAATAAEAVVSGGGTRKHARSLSSMPPASPASLSVNGCASSTQNFRLLTSSSTSVVVPARSHSVSGATGGENGGISITSSNGTPRAQFRACLERQQARGAAELITEEGESTANADQAADHKAAETSSLASSLATELTVFAEKNKKKKKNSQKMCQMKVVNACNSSSSKRTYSLTPNITTTTCNSATTNGKSALFEHKTNDCPVQMMSLSLDCTSASSVQRVSGIKRRSILSIVTRLVRRQAVGRPTLGKKSSEKGAAFEQNGGLDAVAATATTNTNNWPDVVSI